MSRSHGEIVVARVPVFPSLRRTCDVIRRLGRTVSLVAADIAFASVPVATSAGRRGTTDVPPLRRYVNIYI